MDFSGLRVGIVTLGCRVNQYESNAVAEELEKRGFSVCDFNGSNDIYIINTCSVTGISDRKSRQMISRAVNQKKRDSSVVVCAAGCFVQGLKDRSILDNVDIICGNADKSSIPDKICAYLGKRERIDSVKPLSDAGYDGLSISKSSLPRAFVKIEDGCNSFCTYCFVPYVRGRVRSRNPDEVVAEVKRLTDAGFCEAVLTGIEISAYGTDLDGFGLAQLTRRIHNETNVKRIRFGSLNPAILTEEFVSDMLKLERVEKHYHVSVQSGSDSVLAAMRRGYTRDMLVSRLESITRLCPDICLSGDFICGFPGETESDFADTQDIVSRFSFLHSHIFPYSERPGTAAAKMPGSIPHETRRERAERLAKTAESAAKRRRADFDGRQLDMFIEKIRADRVFGYTENMIYVSDRLQEGDSLGTVRKIKL